MARKKRPTGKRTPTTTILCEWCGEQRECTREDTKTCGDRCRTRLSFYTRDLGYPPDETPGDITGQQAVDLEILRLILQERKRRELLALERRQYLASPLGRKLSGADAPHDLSAGRTGTAGKQ